MHLNEAIIINSTNSTLTTTSTRNALKLILLIVLFFGTFLASTSSFLLRRFVLGQQQGNHLNSSTSFKLAFSLLSCFGAGVFLATCLLDLLPDSMDYIKQAEKRMGTKISFPLPSFCVAFGFLLVLLFEQTILYAHKRGWIGNNRMEQLLAHQEDSSLLTLIRRRHHSHENNNEESGFAQIDEQEDAHFDPKTHSTFRVLLLVFALSLHAMFEGLSIGMVSDVPILLQIFFALLIHKIVVGFSLGVRLVQSKLNLTKIVLSCALFSGQILLGGFLGLAIMDILNGSSSIFLISGILQAIACGTFLYVTAFEILPHELENDINIPLKMFSLLIGFGIITGFIAAFPE